MKTQTATATAPKTTAPKTAQTDQTMIVSGHTIHVPRQWGDAPLPQRPTLLHFAPGLGEVLDDGESYPVVYALRASGAVYPVMQCQGALTLHPERYLDDESLSHVGGQVASTL